MRETIVCLTCMLSLSAVAQTKDGGISLQAHRIWFEHPVSHVLVDVTAPLPDDPLWQALKPV